MTDVHVDQDAVDMRYEPDHPDANPEGFVAYPKINLMEEMTNMIQATRGYEANVLGYSGVEGYGSWCFGNRSLDWAEFRSR